MTEKITLRPLRSVLVRSLFHYSILSPAYTSKYPMIIVNILRQISDNSANMTADNSKTVLSLTIRTISNTLPHS